MTTPIVISRANRIMWENDMERVVKMLQWLTCCQKRQLFIYHNDWMVGYWEKNEILIKCILPKVVAKKSNEFFLDRPCPNSDEIPSVIVFKNKYSCFHYVFGSNPQWDAYRSFVGYGKQWSGSFCQENMKTHKLWSMKWTLVIQGAPQTGGNQLLGLEV